MFQFVALAAAIGAISIGLNSAQSTSPKVVIQVRSVSPVDGKQMFTSYCAPCHGRHGGGGGPVAPGLRKPPANLTEIARNHGGRFPESQVVSVMEAGVPSSGNLPSQMPVWGPVFAGISHLGANDKDLRILNLIRYLESIQAR
jgi:mono/diheme cytochrome c family protein